MLVLSFLIKILLVISLFYTSFTPDQRSIATLNTSQKATFTDCSLLKTIMFIVFWSFKNELERLLLNNCRYLGVSWDLQLKMSFEEIVVGVIKMKKRKITMWVQLLHKEKEGGNYIAVSNISKLLVTIKINNNCNNNDIIGIEYQCQQWQFSNNGGQRYCSGQWTEDD